jgi:hypothetical protein
MRTYDGSSVIGNNLQDVAFDECVENWLWELQCKENSSYDVSSVNNQNDHNSTPNLTSRTVADAFETTKIQFLINPIAKAEELTSSPATSFESFAPSPVSHSPHSSTQINDSDYYEDSISDLEAELLYERIADAMVYEKSLPNTDPICYYDFVLNTFPTIPQSTIYNPIRDNISMWGNVDRYNEGDYLLIYDHKRDIY